MDTRFLQANINHCARAQDLLTQSLAEWLIGVAVVAEPYSVPPRDNWVGDLDGLVAIVTNSSAGSSPPQRVERGHGYVAAWSGDVMIVGAYFSPNRQLAEFERFLAEIGTMISRSRPGMVLVAGDLNAKCTAWGSPATDARGAELEEWAVATGLIVLNRGSTNTCVRQQGGSIVDVTFANAALARLVRGWEVLEEVETLSDHRYIRFEVSTLPTTPRGPSRPLRGDGPRWSLKRLDRDLMVEAALVQAWLPGPGGPMDVNAEAENMGGIMVGVCDAAMPRVGPIPPRRRVYWWSQELAQLRESCVAARREYTRSRRRRIRDVPGEERLYAAYSEAVKLLQGAIARAKDLAEQEMLETLNSDPWGRPYRMVRRKLRPWTPPLTQSLQPQLLEQVVEGLFPTRGAHIPPPMIPPRGSEADTGDAPEVTEGELGAAVLRLRAKNTAPGPDGVPGRAWVLALGPLKARLSALFSACLAQGQFPRAWKAGKLVLLRKEGRPADSPSAYRPIVLLDEASKLLERVVAARLNRHLEGIGPDLSDHQFGFRRGRSTIDAIARVRTLAEEAVAQGEVVLAVSLDIANAFNSLPWACITAALRHHAVPEYLRKTVEDYLSDRAVRYPTREEWQEKRLSCGVPQGSVLGPLLWNIGYDWVLRGRNLPGVKVTCYADDTLVTARGSTFQEASIRATAGVATVVARIRRLGLEVALNKSEALCFHGPRKAPPAGSSLVVGGTSIAVKSTMRYLGIILDSRWTFTEHFRCLAPKLMGTASALSRLLPNLDGPNASCRRLYAGVVRSMALYGAPIWAGSLNAKNQAQLRRPQRVMAVRMARAYRTVSYEAACVLAGTPPWDLDASVLANVYWRVTEARARGDQPLLEEIRRWRLDSRSVLIQKWKERLETPSAGHLTIGAIRPVLERWVGRNGGFLSFHLVQILSGHGCFGRYLCRVAGREPTMECHACGDAEDTAQHTLAVCPTWAEQRAALVAVVGHDLSLPAVVEAMVGGDRSWKAVASFCEDVMAQKEAAERGREEDPASQPMRRKRVGRRRLAYDRRIPP
jgi:hypothetical protein